MNTGLKKVKSSRTKLDFLFAGNIFPILEKWASENSFTIRKSARGVIKYRRSGGVKTSPLPDFYIGAQAEIEQHTIVTRDAVRYRTYFPNVRIIAPT